MLVNTFFKEPKKKKHRAKNNPKPTADSICRYCKNNYATTHEVYEGTGRRQLSIKYCMKVKLSMKCHQEVQQHPLQGKDLELKQEFQLKFEKTHTREEFRKLFTTNYL